MKLGRVPKPSTTRAFDQGKYWVDRGRTYVSEFETHSQATSSIFELQEEGVFDALTDRLSPKPLSILEIGCGFGRLTTLLLRLFPAVERYLAVDISSAQIDACAARLEGCAQSSVVETRVLDFRTGCIDETFDMVFAGEVFLHFPPGEIAAVLSQALSLSRRFLVHLDPYQIAPTQSVREWAYTRVSRAMRGLPSKTDWNHDYPRLYDPRAVKEWTGVPIIGGRQTLFIVKTAPVGS